MEGIERPEKQASLDSGLQIGLQDILDSVEDELLVVDTNHRITFVNAAARRNLQGEAATLVGGLCYEILEGRDRPCSAPIWDCPLRKILQSRSMTELIHADRVSAGDRYLKISAYPLSDRLGNVRAIVELRR